MKETPEVLLKRTRSELSEIAEKLGIETAGVSKTKIADLIFKARKKTEKTPATEASKPGAEAPKAGTAFKAQPKPHIGTNIGNKGVFAKRAAISAQMDVNAEAVAAIGIGIKEIHKGINAQIKDNEKAAAKMGTEIKEMHKGVDEMHKGINTQIKDNEKAAAKMGMGIKEMQKGINAQKKENEKAAAKMEIGVKEMHKGIKETRSAMDKKAKEMLQEGAAKLQMGVDEMETKFGDFQNETENYIKDFYYG